MNLQMVLRRQHPARSRQSPGTRRRSHRDFYQGDTALFVAAVAGPLFRRRDGFAEIMRERGESHGERVGARSGVVDHQ